MLLQLAQETKKVLHMQAQETKKVIPEPTQRGEKVLLDLVNIANLSFIR